jgi:type I restriction enzyme M protein
MLERSTEVLIDNILVNKGWILDVNNKKKNVFHQEPKTADEKKKLKGERPDYILYKDEKPIAIIEAKKSTDFNLNKALEQGTKYAEKLGAEIVFATNGIYCETLYLPNKKGLILNGNDVRELLREIEALQFLKEKSNEAYTIPKEVIISRKELINVFTNLNDKMRSEGLRAGIERFGEFSNFLFLKLVSEVKPENAYWNDLKAISSKSRLDYINNTIIRNLAQEYGGNVFLPLNIKNPSTIDYIIEKLDPLVLTAINSDIKGDAFEYFLRASTSTKNDLGEYFTPRHIVKTCVSLVNPTIKDTVYDPFCGTGGFLIESFKHIKEVENITSLSGERFKKLRENTIYGRELTMTARIAKMNMILQSDGHSGVHQTDSLANPVEGLYDCVISNIPFTQKTEHSNKYYNGLAKNNGDGACILHCLKALKEGGRMAVVVPEGFLFKKELEGVRRFLLEKAKLQSVISLPQGCFLPYTGVKTDILYFTNAHEPNLQKEYWYFDVKNDGFTLDSKRKIMHGSNDLGKVEAFDLRKNYTEEVKQKIIENGFEIIPLEKVRANNYNLVGARYREIAKHNGKYEMVRIKDLIEKHIIVAQKGKSITKETIAEGNIPVVAGGQTSPYSHNVANYNGNVITISSSGAYSGYVWYHNYPIWASDCSVFFSNNENILLTKFLYHTLKHQQEEIYKMQNGAGQPHVYIKDIESLYIPLPPLEEQEKILEKLDNIQKAIKDAQTLIEDLKSEGGAFYQTFGNEDWEFIKLEDVCEINPKKPKFDDNVEVSFIDMAAMPIEGYKFKHNNIKTIEEIGKGNTYFAENDVLLAKISPCFENGKCGIATHLKNGKGLGSTEFIVLRAKDNILPEYIYYFISKKDFRVEGKSFMTGTAGRQRISLDYIRELQIPLPTLEIQQEIVAEMEAQEAFIKQTEAIIEKLKSKAKIIVSKLWEM